MPHLSLSLDTFLSRFQLLQPVHRKASHNLRLAAVLVPIVKRPQPGLLLTLRASTLRKHAGQVAFPGGAVDKSDDSLIAAALRETYEEIGILPQRVEVMGILPPVDSISGFQVTPVVGLIPADIAWSLSVDEVSAVFEMPLDEALRLGRYHPLNIYRRGNERRVWLSWYQHYFIWGMTADIIRALALQIGDVPDDLFNKR